LQSANLFCVIVFEKPCGGWRDCGVLVCSGVQFEIERFAELSQPAETPVDAWLIVGELSHMRA
jgi:hypothetical protein